MNALPEHRRVLHGRTYPQRWSAADMDPIERPVRRAVPVTDEALGAMLAIAIGVLLAMALVHWLAGG